MNIADILLSSTSKDSAIPIVLLTKDQFPNWLKDQSPFTRQWLTNNAFSERLDGVSLIPDKEGKLSQVVLINKPEDFLYCGGLPLSLPENIYYFTDLNSSQIQQAGIAWGLGAYQFTKYKKSTKKPAKLLLKPEELTTIAPIVEAIYLVRDLINTPAEDMGPVQLAAAAKDLAKTYDANYSEIVGDKLLKQNYPCIHAVGRASAQEPRLIDFQWGKSNHPKITLVGKGVCFDTGGLDLKPCVNMQLMKKDMGGAAHALGLAQLIMSQQLPVRLRVLIPAVENSVAANAYRPGDVLNTRKGLTVEIGNTDAEGRLVLADALAEAATENPELLIDFSTLTGAARVAVGLDIAAMFTADDKLANELMKHSDSQQDALWRLPLYKPYRKLIDSTIADINNCGFSPYAGAITAGLFLQEFVAPVTSWVHLDFMAWNMSARPGRPEGGEAITLRALWSYLTEKYSHK